MKTRDALRLAATGIAVYLASACHEPAAPHEALIAGRSSYLYATPPGTWYPGEIRIAGPLVARVYITNDLPMRVLTSAGSTERATFETLALGDSVEAWYDTDGPVLTSDPPVYPVVRIIIRR